MKRCPLCHRPVRYAWVYYSWSEDHAYRFCSQFCNDWWIKMYPQQHEQLTRVDIEAIEASLPDLGAVVAEIGMDKPVANYSKDEVLRLICEAYGAVERHRMRIIGQEEIPF